MPREDRLISWQAPPFEHPDTDGSQSKLGWVRQAIDHGTRWVEAQTDGTESHG